MKLKNINIFSALMAGLIFISAISNISRADCMEELKKYKTGENIYLNSRPIRLPKEVSQKEEEFRGVWVSTIYNLDFPSKPGLSMEEYKGEYLKLLEEVEKLNLNSVIFQVRPKGDAFYESDLNPWSENLSDKEGKSPGWDPLEWMVDETHKKGLEFHAWFNPYRVTVAYDDKTGKIDQLNKLSEKNWARKNPDHVFKYGGKLYLNPASQDVIDYVNDSIMEVVYKYNIDGIHLDDYFYPNKDRKSLEEFYSKEEEISYREYGSGYDSVSSWRRDNVNKLIEKISGSIKTYNKANQDNISFGVSPFGIWGHRIDHPEGSLEGVGSNTPKSSQASYDNQFADTRKWVKEGWLDYIAPQIYWTFDQKAAPYGELVNWWAETVRGTGVDLYIGHALYKKAENDVKNSWSNPEEISNQLKFNSLYDEVKGDIYFRYKNILKSDNQVNNQFLEILKNKHYNKKAETPRAKKSQPKEVEKPFELDVNSTIVGNLLTWKDRKDNPSQYYLVYREELINGKLGNKELISSVYRKNRENFISFLDKTAEPNRAYRYSVSSMSR